LFSRRHDLGCIVLRTSRFFPEEDDDPAVRREYENDNVKTNEFLFRRVELADVVAAHVLAFQQAQSIGFGRFIVSATTPFRPADLHELSRNAAAVVGRRIPQYEKVYAQRRWRMLPTIDRVYVNDRARTELRWSPKHDFAYQIDCLRTNVDPRSELATAVGAKGYHAQSFDEGPYPVE
jgi:nucleoside-diphosphate-sugar epimerase